MARCAPVRSHCGETWGIGGRLRCGEDRAIATSRGSSPCSPMLPHVHPLVVDAASYWRSVVDHIITGFPFVIFDLFSELNDEPDTTGHTCGLYRYLTHLS